MSTDTLITADEARALRECLPDTRALTLMVRDGKHTLLHGDTVDLRVVADIYYTQGYGYDLLFAKAPSLALTVEALWQRLADAERERDEARAQEREAIRRRLQGLSDYHAEAARTAPAGADNIAAAYARVADFAASVARELASNERCGTDDVPRHLRVALANATRAFQHGDRRSLATVNEDIQPLVDAAMTAVSKAEAERDALRAEVERLRGEAEAAEHVRALLRELRDDGALASCYGIDRLSAINGAPLDAAILDWIKGGDRG